MAGLPLSKESCVLGRKSFLQFGLRTLLGLIAVSAAGAWLARNEMDREERREQLIAELDAKDATWSLFRAKGPPHLSPPPQAWWESIGAWLRGKPMVRPRAGAIFPKGISPHLFREFLDLFPSIQSVTIDANDCTADVLDLFAAHGPYHEFVIYPHLAVDENVARSLARIKCAAGIRLADQECSDVSLKNLADAGVKFEHFSCRHAWCEVGDDGLKAAARLTGITEICANCRGTDEGLNAFAGYPFLTALSVKGPGYSDASADAIPSLAKLEVLRIKRTRHTDAGLARAISGCTARAITFEDAAVGDATLAALRKAPHLEYLYFINVDLTVAQCGALAELPLASLYLKSDRLTDEHVAGLAPFAATLTAFTLGAPQVTDRSLAWLGRADKLTALYLNETQATAATWSLLRPSVSAVGLDGTNVNSDTLAAISKLGTVANLSLSGSEIDDDVVALIPDAFAKVSLTDTRVTLKGLRRLFHMENVDSVDNYYHRDAQALITREEAFTLQIATRGKIRTTFQSSWLLECDCSDNSRE
jgi:hypothetical protein